MGTRSIIGYKNEKDEFKGVYCHWDGYPTGVGRVLYNFAVAQGIQAAISHLVDTKVCGWSSLASWDGDPAHFVGFDDHRAVPYDQRYTEDNDPYKNHAVYYTGDRADSVFHDRTSAQNSWDEWLYEFDPKTNTLEIFKLSGSWIKRIAVLPLVVLADVIDWEKIESQGYETD